jgi:hypothetical protein
MAPMRRLILLLVAATALIGLFALGLTYAQGGSDAVERRAAALPAYARTYLRNLRPTPVMPTPPPVSAARRAALLQAHLPTVIPTAVLPSPLPPTATPSPPLPTPLTLTPLPSATATATETPSPTPTATATPSHPRPERPRPAWKVSPTTHRCGTTAARRPWP